MTPTPVTWSETPPSEDGQFHLSKPGQSGHRELLIGQKTGNWWLILGWHCDEYHSEDLVQMGIAFGPRITLTPAPPAMEWVDVETAMSWPDRTRVVQRYRRESKEWSYSFQTACRDEEFRHHCEYLVDDCGGEVQFARLDGGQA